MAVVVRSNPMSYAISRSLSASQEQMSRTTTQLSTGLRVNKAADDAAGLAIGEKIKAQVQGLGQAIRNARDATNMVQTAEGGLATMQEMLPRMRELTLPLLSKIPIPYKMVIVSPHLITGVARTLELEIAAFDKEKNNQVRHSMQRLCYRPFP